MISEIRIRAFRATDDPETCQKFIFGHRKVLENHGIEKVTSSTDAWMYDTSVFVVVVESLDREKLFGGVRIHCVDGKSKLPIEIATEDMDPKIRDVVKKYAQYGTAELCGLWNSIEVAGFGIGSLFPTRAAIVLLEQLGLQSLFFLCSPFTLRFHKWLGSRLLKEVGNEGTFYYPKFDLLATAVVLEDAVNIPLCHPREKAKVFSMRDNLTMTTHEKSPFKNLDMVVQNDLLLPNAFKDEFVLGKEAPLKIIQE